MLLFVVCSFDRVKLGFDTKDGGHVAVKLMYRDKITPRAAQQLNREVQVQYTTFENSHQQLQQHCSNLIEMLLCNDKYRLCSLCTTLTSWS
jgi:hypothetical protein